MHTITTYLEIPVELEYAILPGSPGSSDAYGAPTEPETSPSIELASLRIMIGRDRIPLRLDSFDKRQREAWREEIEEALRA